MTKSRPKRIRGSNRVMKNVSHVISLLEMSKRLLKSAKTNPEDVDEHIVKRIETIMRHFTDAISLRKNELMFLDDWKKTLYGAGSDSFIMLYLHLDLDKTKSVSSWWRICGQAHTILGEKQYKKVIEGTVKLDHNKKLRKACYYMAENFIQKKVSPYYEIYKERKEYETEKNNNAEYRDIAFYILKALKTRSMEQITSNEYKTNLMNGRLGKAHLDMRARRYMIKIFLSHIYSIKHMKERGVFPEEHLRKNYIEIPNLDLIKF